MVECCDGCFQERGIKEFIRENGVFSEEQCPFCKKINTHRLEPSDLGEMISPVIYRSFIHFDYSLSSRRKFQEGETLLSKFQNRFSVFSLSLAETTQRKLLDNILIDSGLITKNGAKLSDSWFDRDDSDKLDFPISSYLSLLEKAIRKYGHSLTFNKVISTVELDDATRHSFKIFIELLEKIDVILQKNVDLWRARIGKDHSGSSIIAPPPEKARAGRANLLGQPFLYCADSVLTAINEVRPAKKDIVSVSKFKLKREVKLCDLLPRQTSLKYSPFTHYDLFLKYLEVLETRETLGKMFGEPIRPSDESTEYLVTQFLAQTIREYGFDGIIYPSSQNNSKSARGINFLFFNPLIAIPIPPSVNYLIDNITIKVVALIN